MGKYQRLKDLREDKDMNQSELAKIIDTSQKQYSRWETGEYTIPFDIAIKLAKFYKVSLDYIAGLTNDKRGIGYNSKTTVKQTYNANNQTVINNIKEK